MPELGEAEAVLGFALPFAEVFAQGVDDAGDARLDEGLAESGIIGAGKGLAGGLQAAFKGVFVEGNGYHGGGMWGLGGTEKRRDGARRGKTRETRVCRKKGVERGREVWYNRGRLPNRGAGAPGLTLGVICPRSLADAFYRK